MLIDCAVVGAGPAGLATSAALSARGVEHVVLERGRVGELAHPAVGVLPAEHAGVDEPVARRAGTRQLCHRGGSRPAAGEARRYLPGPRRGAGGPVGTRRRRFVLQAGGVILARTVVVATGARTCRRSLRLPASSPTELPNTTPPTTAVPTNSPTRRCWWWAAPSPAARSPRTCGWRPASGAGDQPRRSRAFRHRGRESIEWLAKAGFMDQRPRDLPDPSVMRAAMPIIAPGRGLSRRRWPGPASPWPGGRSGWTATGSPSTTASEPTWAAGDAFAAGQGDDRPDHPPPRPGRPARRARRP